MSATVVALDLSLTSTGVADRNGTRRIRPKSTGVERLAEVRNCVLWECRLDTRDPSCRPSLVVIEGYSYASKGQAVVDIGELGGVVRLALYEAGIRYEVVSPSTVKIYGTGKGNASKDEMLLAAVRRFGYEGTSHDEADALILWHLAMAALGEPVVTVPQAHLRALKALPWLLADLMRHDVEERLPGEEKTA